jgi:Zn-dependent protease with chaperone function
VTRFAGTFLDGRSSRVRRAVCTVAGGRAEFREEGGAPLLETAVDELRIEPRLGGTERAIALPGGARFLTKNLGAVAALEEAHGRNRGFRFVHALEARWMAAAACLAALALAAGGFVAYGIPFLAALVAERAPLAVSTALGERTLEALDGRYLAPSALPAERQAEVRATFEEVRREVGGVFPERPEFRKGRLLGPNAIALPSGVVIVTDELVELAAEPRELAGVFAHEIAHVERRHGLRSVLQSAGVYLLISALAGDVTSIASLAGTLPTLLAESGYSRAFEREADDAAARYAISRGWGVGPYTAILRRLAEKRPDLPALSYLSTHPLTAERIAAIERAGAAAAP